MFSLGLSCSLRAGKEHRSLRSPPFKSQFQFLNDSDGKVYVWYTEDLGLKTNKGSLKYCKIDGKVVEFYQINDIDRCPVRILQTYLSKLPKVRNSTALYL